MIGSLLRKHYLPISYCWVLYCVTIGLHSSVQCSTSYDGPCVLSSPYSLFQGYLHRARKGASDKELRNRF